MPPWTWIAALTTRGPASLEGLRDLSVIATAPERRLAIKTFVRNESSGTIREAILRELKRGGQAYFLHNDVQTI